MTWRILEHDADTGLRVEADSPEELLAEALRGMFSLIVEAETVAPRETLEVAAEGSDHADLLYATLSEALSLAMARRIAVSQVEILDFAPGRARARLRGEPFDPGRHALGIEVKAVTRHGLRLETCPLKPGAASSASGRAALAATVYFDV